MAVSVIVAGEGSESWVRWVSWCRGLVSRQIVSIGSVLDRWRRVCSDRSSDCGGVLGGGLPSPEVVGGVRRWILVFGLWPALFVSSLVVGDLGRCS